MCELCEKFKAELRNDPPRDTAHEWIGVDLDGTLAVSEETYNPLTIGAPVPKMVERVKQALAEGKTVKIFTARVTNIPWDEELVVRAVITKWCIDNLDAVLAITCQKDAGMTELWDDRARRVEKNTGEFIRGGFQDALPKKATTDSSVASGTDRDNAMELFADRDDKIQAVPDTKPRRLGIGYGVIGNPFPEACAMELFALGPQGEPIYRYSEDQPRDDHGRFGSTGEAPLGADRVTGREYAGPMTMANGDVIHLSADRNEKVAQMHEYADKQLAALPANIREQYEAGKFSEQIYSDGKGKYTQERIDSFHSPEIDRHLAGQTTQENPRFVLVAGGPASGKSGSTEKAMQELAVRAPINVDIIRTHTPEYGAFAPDRLKPLNDEAGFIRDRIIDESRANGYNILVDGVGSDSTAKAIEACNKEGYQTTYIYTHANIADAERRAEDRPYHTSRLEDLRILPQGMVRGSHEKGRAAFEKIAALAHEVKVLDKSDPKYGRDGMVVYHRIGNDVKVYDHEGVMRVRENNDAKTKIGADAFRH